MFLLVMKSVGKPQKFYILSDNVAHAPKESIDCGRIAELFSTQIFFFIHDIS